MEEAGTPPVKRKTDRRIGDSKLLPCKEEGCMAKVFEMGMCSFHWRSWIEGRQRKVVHGTQREDETKTGTD